MDLLVIYPGQQFLFDPQSQFPGSSFTRSEEGWINRHIFKQWLESTLISVTDVLEKPVVLFVDGHASSMATHEISAKRNILIYTLLVHANHTVQPLDLVFYKCLKTESDAGA